MVTSKSSRSIIATAHSERLKKDDRNVRWGDSKDSQVAGFVVQKGVVWLLRWFARPRPDPEPSQQHTDAVEIALEL